MQGQDVPRGPKGKPYLGNNYDPNYVSYFRSQLNENSGYTSDSGSYSRVPSQRGYGGPNFRGRGNYRGNPNGPRGNSNGYQPNYVPAFNRGTGPGGQGRGGGFRGGRGRGRGGNTQYNNNYQNSGASDSEDEGRSRNAFRGNGRPQPRSRSGSLSSAPGTAPKPKLPSYAENDVRRTLENSMIQRVYSHHVKMVRASTGDQTYQPKIPDISASDFKRALADYQSYKALKDQKAAEVKSRGIDKQVKKLYPSFTRDMYTHVDGSVDMNLFGKMARIFTDRGMFPYTHATTFIEVAEYITEQFTSYIPKTHHHYEAIHMALTRVHHFNPSAVAQCVVFSLGERVVEPSNKKKTLTSSAMDSDDDTKKGAKVQPTRSFRTIADVTLRIELDRVLDAPHYHCIKVKHQTPPFSAELISYTPGGVKALCRDTTDAMLGPLLVGAITKRKEKSAGAVTREIIAGFVDENLATPAATPPATKTTKSSKSDPPEDPTEKSPTKEMQKLMNEAFKGFDEEQTKSALRIVRLMKLKPDFFDSVNYLYTKKKLSGVVVEAANTIAAEAVSDPTAGTSSSI